MLGTKLMRGAEAPQEPILLGPALLAPPAGTAGLPTGHRTGAAELVWSMLLAGGWGLPPQIPRSPALL